MQIPEILTFFVFYVCQDCDHVQHGGGGGGGAVQMDTIKASLAVTESEAKQAFRS